MGRHANHLCGALCSCRRYRIHDSVADSACPALGHSDPHRDHCSWPFVVGCLDRGGSRPPFLRSHRMARPLGCHSLSLKRDQPRSSRRRRCGSFGQLRSQNPADARAADCDHLRWLLQLFRRDCPVDVRDQECFRAAQSDAQRMESGTGAGTGSSSQLHRRISDLKQPGSVPRAENSSASRSALPGAWPCATYSTGSRCAVKWRRNGAS